MRTIVWDVDDVLNNLLEHWLERWRKEHPECKVAYGELRQNPPHEQLGLSFETYLASLDEIRGSVSAHEELTPNADITTWFRDYGSRFRHVALTARAPHTSGPASAWVLRHFGTWIRTFAFIPVRPPKDWPTYDESKADYLQWLDPDAILIDDAPANVDRAKEKGLSAILYPQPWNASTQSKGELLKQLATL